MKLAGAELWFVTLPFLHHNSQAVCINSQESTVKDMYTCLHSVATPHDYASRAYVGIPGVDQGLFEPWAAGGNPYAQFVFYGHEAKEGLEQVSLRPSGTETQRIYKEDYHVFWKELHVWIGCPATERNPFSHYHTVAHLSLIHI